MTKKDTREELEQETLLASLQQDVAAEATPVLEFITQHAKTIIASLAALVVMIGGYGVYDYTDNQALKQARMDLGNIIVNLQPQERSAALASFVAEAPAALKRAVLVEQLRVNAADEAYGNMAVQWEGLAAGAGSDLNVIAGMGKVSALLAAGNAGEAFTASEALVASAPEAYKVIVNRQMAVVAEEAGKLEAAIAAYEVLHGELAEQEKAYHAHKIAVLRARMNG